MKQISLLLFFTLSISCLQSQKVIPIPKVGAFEDYLYARQHAIEEKLYKAALEGRIKAYKTDSLASVHSLADLQLRGSTENQLRQPDGSYKVRFEPFLPNELKGLMFVRKVEGSALEGTEKTSLKCISLMFQPVIGGALLSRQPIFYVSAQDLKTSLEMEEMAFVNLLSYYAGYSNYYFDYWWSVDESYDPYENLNIYSSSAVNPDSSFYRRMAHMLVYSYFNINLPFNTEAIIYDEQQKKVIDLATLESQYTYPETVFLSTDPNNPAIGKDTTFQSPVSLRHVSSVCIDNTSRKITKYQYQVELPPGKKINFHIPASYNNQDKRLQPILWFYEDYFRWAKL